jgi:hypothetical protein
MGKWMLEGLKVGRFTVGDGDARRVEVQRG